MIAVLQLNEVRTGSGSDRVDQMSTRGLRQGCPVATAPSSDRLFLSGERETERKFSMQ